MKTTVQTLLLAMVTALGIPLTAAPAQGPAAVADAAFSYSIPFETGASAFATGNRITIVSVRGTRRHFEPGGSYLVQGTYTLASVSRAALALYCTSRGPSGPTPTGPQQQIFVKQGSGNFSLQATMPYEGWWHVSFYDAEGGDTLGGVYFGEKGVARTILRQREWPGLSGGSVKQGHGAAGQGGSYVVDRITSGSNAAIMAYLGDPVPPPANLATAYTAAGLKAAFADLCKKAGLQIEKLAVDRSEFPFLVYGRLSGAHDFRELQKDLGALKSYAYGGSVVGISGDGDTYFALNMTPDGQYPADRAVACTRRLMIRLQMLAGVAQRSK